jgi:AcrR family transcriptional regulator
VGRWSPDARGRLEGAALELFVERGFAHVTAVEIAERAGVTERTFFRHYPTKEEVLFADGDRLIAAIVEAVESPPPGSSMRTVMTSVADRLGELFQAGRSSQQKRARIIAAEPALQERELLKQEHWGAAVASAIERRGIPPLRAALLGSMMTGLFRVVYGEWLRERTSTSLADRLHAALDELLADLG